MRTGKRQPTAAWVRFGAAAACLLLAPVPALRAADTTPPVVGGQFLDEGFEDTGTFPPVGWAYTPISVPPYAWHSSTNPLEVHGGAASAAVQRKSVFDYDQHEVLYSPRIDLQAAPPAGLRLSFWYRTDPFWFHGDNTVFRVHASTDSASWTPLFRLDDVTETGWAWRNVVVDLAGFVGQPDGLLLRFTYHGVDLADLAIDDVRVGYLEAPSPPVNDTCAGASINAFTIGPDPGAFEVTGNSFFALHDYTLPAGTSCTGYAADSHDLVWRVLIPAGHRLTATMNTLGDWDDTLFLVADCGDPGGTCVAGDRGFPDGAHLSWANPAGTTSTYWLVASGWGSAAGEFLLDGAIEPVLGVESMTWGRIKAGYRGGGR